MDLNTSAAIIAAVAAIVSPIISFFALKPAQRAARAAEEQTNIQRQLMQQTAQPYIWADIQADSKQGDLLHLVLGNSGPTVARNVRVTIDPSISSKGNAGCYAEHAQRRLREGVLSLAPGRTIRWSLGLGSDLLKSENDETVYRIVVTGEGPYGPLDPWDVLVRPSDWRESLDQPDGSLHLVRKSIDELAKAIRQ